MTRWALRNCDGTIAVSQALADDADEIAGEALRSRVIYNGVVQSFIPSVNRDILRRQLGLPAKARIILFVGRCEKDKGVFELIESFGLIANKNRSAELIFVGDGGARQELEKVVQPEEWRNRVRFVGLVGRKEITSYYQSADIFVLPSYGEGMPNALLEAMAVGLPCVATRVGGIPEAVQDGVNGLLIPSRSATAITTALNSLLASPELAFRMGAAAAKTIRNHFTWQANAQAHLAFYEEVIRNFRARQK